jgi:hypothetical protein
METHGPIVYFRPDPWVLILSRTQPVGPHGSVGPWEPVDSVAAYQQLASPALQRNGEPPTFTQCGGTLLGEGRGTNRRQVPVAYTLVARKPNPRVRIVQAVGAIMVEYLCNGNALPSVIGRIEQV